MASPNRKYSLPPTENFRHVIQRDPGEPNLGDGTGTLRFFHTMFFLVPPQGVAHALTAAQLSLL